MEHGHKGQGMGHAFRQLVLLFSLKTARTGNQVFPDQQSLADKLKVVMEIKRKRGRHQRKVRSGKE